MKSRLLMVLTPLALAVGVGSSAQATMVAGWDFSQYAGDGFMSTDFVDFVDTLDANYSDLDPSFGAGAESAAFGTLYVDGSFGSTDVDAGSGTEEFVPSAALGGSLLSNLGAPGGTDFDSFTILASEGQLATESLAMLATQASVVVFEADLSSVGQAGSDWSLSFAARMSSGTSTILLEFSSDGVVFTSAGSVNVNVVDTPFSVALGADTTQTAYVRLTFAPNGLDQPAIDNVAISAATLSAVPEPSTALLGWLGATGLAFAGRRRASRG